MYSILAIKNIYKKIYNSLNSICDADAPCVCQLLAGPGAAISPRPQHQAPGGDQCEGPGQSGREKSASTATRGMLR